MSIRLLELFGRALPESGCADEAWAAHVAAAPCPFRGGACDHVDPRDPARAARPHGVCLVGEDPAGDGDATSPVPVCPSRLLATGAVIEDARRLLLRGGEGYELYLLPGVAIPGGGPVDYLLVSARDGLPADFVGLDLQCLRTTGPVWAWRDEALARADGTAPSAGASPEEGGERLPELDWHETAKELLVSLHNKLGFFERLGKRLVVAAPSALVDYMMEDFGFDLLPRGHGRESLRMHAYAFPAAEADGGGDLTPRMTRNLLLDSVRVALALGLQASVQDEFSQVMDQLAGRMTPEYRWHGP